MEFFITVYFFASYFVYAQVSDCTYNSKSVSSENNYGQLIMEMPLGAKLYKSDNINAQGLLDNIKFSCKGKAIFF